jgi:catechol 2,3-dioxygenase-like lactoylglutathione lyase family enzyme
MSRTIPILPCRDIDDIVPFYEALGFRVTHRQVRPNPFVALQREDVDLQFFGLAAFDPATSMGSCLLVVPDTRMLFDEFAAGLRERYGRLPVSGIPRITRPRERRGAGGGFSVVDPGGNWIRVTQDREGASDATPATTGPLELVLQAAARQGDARGEEATAIEMLRNGLERHPDAPDAERLPVLTYLAELLVRVADPRAAAEVLDMIDGLDLDRSDALVREQLEVASSIRADLGPTAG